MDITRLIPDIYDLVKRKDGWFNDELAAELGREVGRRIQVQFSIPQRKGTLRLSRMGLRCPCALWYETNHPELAEAIPPWAEIKYNYGHIIEALAIVLAKAAGHSVTGEQDAVEVDGILGHRDCVVDGSIVDVKSTTSRSFSKFKDGSIESDDPFGYLDQLDGYLVGSLNDPLVTNKESAFILAVDKQLGHMVTYEHTVRPERIKSRIEEYKLIVAQSKPPRCTCGTVPDGKSGNLRLDVKASYSAFKFCCNPNLRTFLYSDGPRYLTKVVRLPDVTEIDRYGNIVYPIS